MQVQPVALRKPLRLRIASGVTAKMVVGGGSPLSALRCVRVEAARGGGLQLAELAGIATETKNTARGEMTELCDEAFIGRREERWVFEPHGLVRGR